MRTAGARGGTSARAELPGADGTVVDLSAFTADATAAAARVARLSVLALGQALPAAPRDQVIQAVAWWTDKTEKGSE